MRNFLLENRVYKQLENNFKYNRTSTIFVKIIQQKNLEK